MTWVNVVLCVIGFAAGYLLGAVHAYQIVARALRKPD